MSQLEQHGISETGTINWNLSTPKLYEAALRRGEGEVAQGGPLVVDTGEHTGRSAKDKFTVKEASSENDIDWGSVNVAIDEESFKKVRAQIVEHYKGKEIFVADLYAGAEASTRLKVRVINENAWHNLFVQNLFINPPLEDLAGFAPEFTILHAPSLELDPAEVGTRSKTAIIVNFGAKEVLIAGTSYAGEQKKSVFGILNYLLPAKGIMPMHCSVNVGDKDDSAIFFGLSGTGKTTLSADPNRTLIGDDEHGWSDDGLFNFEGGCYAKVIDLSAEAEPEIYATTSMFGTVLENVIMDERGNLDLTDRSKTENTRAAYPLEFIPNAAKESVCGHPKNVIMLTADAFGVLPPIAKMTPEQAMYHFLSGYTAKVAGTEKGVTEPTATFSTCFGAPFMPRHPSEYGKLLADKIAKHGVNCWLVNTGWTGGKYGEGHRMSIKHTRALLNAALDGSLNSVEFRTDPNFGLEVPVSVPGIPDEVLDPRQTWADKDAYDKQAAHLVDLFNDNFGKYDDYVSDEVKAAAPKVS